MALDRARVDVTVARALLVDEALGLDGPLPTPLQSRVDTLRAAENTLRNLLSEAKHRSGQPS